MRKYCFRKIRKKKIKRNTEFIREQKRYVDSGGRQYDSGDKRDLAQ